MLTLEEQVSLLADAAVQRSMPDASGHLPQISVDGGRPCGTRRLVAIAASVMLVMLVVGLATSGRDPDESIPADQPWLPTAPSGATNPPTVTYPMGESWYIPTYLPDDLIFDRAEFMMDIDQAVRYVSNVPGRSISIRYGDRHAPAPVPDRQIEIGGEDWGIVDTDPPSDWLLLYRPMGDVGFLVQSEGIAETTLVEIVASIERLPVETLPRPPLPLTGFGGTRVAQTTQDGVTARLFANTDGVYFALSVARGDGGERVGGGSENLGDGVLVVTGSSGPDPTMLVDDKEAESLIYGMVRSDVERVEVELTDGRVISAGKQDLSAQFIEDFFMIAVPTRTDTGLDLVAAIVALDHDGNELARQDQAFE